MGLENKKYICVGKIVNTHGLRGEVKIYSYLNPKEDFEFIENLIVDANSDVSRNSQSEIADNKLIIEGRCLKLSSVRYQKNMVLAKFDGLNNIEDVEDIKNHLVYAFKDDIASEDGFFYSDIVGFDVIDEKLGWIGVISDITQGVAQDIFTVELSNGNTFMIPSVKEFIKDIDMTQNKVIVAIIDGMM